MLRPRLTTLCWLVVTLGVTYAPSVAKALAKANAAHRNLGDTAAATREARQHNEQMLAHEDEARSRAAGVQSVCAPPCAWQNSWGNSAGGVISWDHAYFGGMTLQFMQAEGLRAHHKLLEVAVGSFSAAAKFAENLNPGNLYGIDISEEQLRYGYHYAIENRGLQSRLPWANLRATDSFDVSGWGTFDFAWSLSLWTHLPYAAVAKCLRAVHDVLNPGGVYYTTAFIVPLEKVNRRVRLHSHMWKDDEFNTLHSGPNSDPYHFSIETMHELAKATGGMELTHIKPDEWGNLRGQHMLKFVKPKA